MVNISLKKRNDAPRPEKKDRQIKKTAHGHSKRFFLNSGDMDNLKKGAVIRTICSRAGITSEEIGSIEIMREFTFFEVESSAAAKVLKSMKGAKIDGRSIRVQYAENKKPQTKHTHTKKKRKKKKY